MSRMQTGDYKKSTTNLDPKNFNVKDAQAILLS